MVLVHDQRGQPIRLAEHHAVAVSVPEAQAVIVCRLDARLEKRLVRRSVRVADHHAHQDLGQMVDISLAEKIPVKIIDCGKFAVLSLALNAGDLVGIHPCMPRADAFVLIAFEIDLIHNFLLIQ